MKKLHINLYELQNRLEKSKKLSDESVIEIGKKLNPMNIYQTTINNDDGVLINIESFDKLDYANLIYDDVVIRLVEYLKDRNIDIENTYNKLRLHRNAICHADEETTNDNTADYEYVKSILIEWQKKPPTQEEMSKIESDQIQFGESLGIYKDSDTQTDKLMKSYKAIKFIENLVGKKKK